MQINEAVMLEQAFQPSTDADICISAENQNNFQLWIDSEYEKLQDKKSKRNETIIETRLMRQSDIANIIYQLENPNHLRFWYLNQRYKIMNRSDKRLLGLKFFKIFIIFFKY